MLFLILGVQNQARATIGAATPFVSYEAEAGLLGDGAAEYYLTNPPTTRYSSPELEASGHAYVQLNDVGQFVQWTNDTGQNITAVNLRSCIPDAPNGGGITNTIDLYVNGTFRQAFSVNSLQNYCYEGTNYNGQTDKNPADGNPRGFWNDTHAFIAGNPVAPGDTIRFQEDAANTAAFYDIDVIDVENPPAPLAQPADSLSITDYGAVSNNIVVDNTSAINNCFSAAHSQGKIAWIPSGTFYFSAIHGGLNASGITIEGAGPWYSTLYRVIPPNNSQGVANIITTISCTLSNVLLDCNGSSRAGNNNNGAVNFYGTNWVVNNVWIQHATSAFWCAGVNGIAENCRVLSVWSDGGNFNNVQSDNGIGMGLTYSNNFVRGTGDDAMAINSVNYNVYGSATNYYTIMRNIRYVSNTAIAPWGGKCMAIYGGINDVVTNNLLRDTARYIGLGVGKFGVNGSPLLSATVTGNTVLRCGGNGYDQQQQAMMIGNGGDGQSVGMIANAFCASNTIIDSLYDAVSFSSSTNIIFQRNTIINPGLDAMAIGPPDLGSAVTGSAIIYSNIVTGLSAGHFILTNSAIAYASIIPITAANYSGMAGVTTEVCAEGGTDINNLESGNWTVYDNVNLDNVNTFVARVASDGSGGDIEIHLDSPAGTLVGTCEIPITGDWQAWTNVYCKVSAASGNHNVYLVYSGESGTLFSIEYFGLYSAPPEPSHQFVPGNIYTLKSLANGRYVSASDGGAGSLIAQSDSVSAAEEFKIIDAGDGNIGFEALVNSNIVTAENAGNSPLIANRTSVGSWETFTEVDAGEGNIGLRAVINGEYVTAPNGGAGALIASSTSIGAPESFTVGLAGPPAAPGNLATTPGNSQITLSWATSFGTTGYNVKRSIVSGGPYTLIASNITALSYTNIGLANGTTYYFVVSALDPFGEGDDSSQAGAIAGSLDRTNWAAAASSTESGGSPRNAIDGDINTRWSTGAPQTPGQWFQVDMGMTNTFYEIILNAAASSGDYPRGYQVNVSDDGINWGSPVATGAGTSALTTISFLTQTARYIRVTQTGSNSGLWWSIHEFNVLGVIGTAPATPSGLAATPGDGQVILNWTASADATCYNVKRSLASDGTYSIVATNLNALSFTNNGLSDGIIYYFVVSATNAAGESANSTAVSVRPVSLTPPHVNFGTEGGQLQIVWPQNRTGWTLQVQTNSLEAGIGTNWVTVPDSEATNQIMMPMNPANGSVFFRLVYP
ncbi:MAG: carbohydrate-binding protein [Limisphaerales bacterium]